MNKDEGRGPKTGEITILFFFYNAENHLCLKFKHTNIAYHCTFKICLLHIAVSYYKRHCLIAFIFYDVLGLSNKTSCNEISEIQFLMLDYIFL